MSYGDYLEYWLDNYCRVNLKYNTIQKYQYIIKRYIRPKMVQYRLSTITSVSLRSYFKNILKVVKGKFRDACNLYGFLKYNSALTLRFPKIDKEKQIVKHLSFDILTLFLYLEILSMITQQHYYRS